MLTSDHTRAMAQQQQRGRGAAVAPNDGMGKLADILERMAARGQPERRFKAPEYDGTSDVELFVDNIQM